MIPELIASIIRTNVEKVVKHNGINARTLNFNCHSTTILERGLMGLSNGASSDRLVVKCFMCISPDIIGNELRCVGD
jgi:hypothetical protein